MKRYLLPIICLSLLLPVYTNAQPEPESTRLVVRAKAKDAKFIGTSMGGARIVVRDAETGVVLSSGFTEGSTGNTQQIMNTPRTREMQISTPGAAKFETTLDLAEPRLVTIEATAPYVQKQSQATVTTQVWVVPGKDITGDGIVLEIPGFAVDLLQPQAHRYTDSDEISIRANVVMMCGCPTSPGGLWNSSEYEISAMVRQEGKTLETLTLEFAGQTSTYEAVFTPGAGGIYEIVVYAYDPDTGNTGVDRTSVIITD